MKLVHAGVFASACLLAQPAAAQDGAEAPSAFTVNGAATIISNYRFRGIPAGLRDAAYLKPGFRKGQDGTGAIAGAALVASLTASF
jgi:hypothetical protein